MLGEALAGVLRSQLGQYLHTEDLEVSASLFGKPIELKNVKLKESVLREANLPLRSVLQNNRKTIQEKATASSSVYLGLSAHLLICLPFCHFCQNEW